MTVALGLYIGIFAAVLVALVARRRLTNHVMLGIAGALGLLYGMTVHGMLGVILPFLILIVAGVQAISVISSNRSARFTAEEQAMFEGPLKGLGRAQARRLIDQGVWIDGRKGDVLIREGEPAAQLFFLATGSGQVRSQGRRSAASRPASLPARPPCSARQRRSPQSP